MQSNLGNPSPAPLPHNVDDEDFEDFQRWCAVVQIFKEFLECIAVIKFIEETCDSFFSEVVKDIKYSNQRYGYFTSKGGSNTIYWHECTYWKQFDEKYGKTARLNLKATGFTDSNLSYTTSLILPDGSLQPIPESVQVAKIFSGVCPESIYSLSKMDISALMNIVMRYAPFRIFDNKIGNNRLYDVAHQIRGNRNVLFHSDDYKLNDIDFPRMVESVIDFLEMIKSIYHSPTIAHTPSNIFSPLDIYVRYINNGGNFLPQNIDIQERVGQIDKMVTDIIILRDELVQVDSIKAQFPDRKHETMGRNVQSVDI